MEENEYFRRFMSMDISLVEEDISDVKEREQAWNFVSCLYGQGGIVDENGDFNKDGFDMYVGAIWKGKDEKKNALSIIKAAAEEASTEGSCPAEKALFFYRKLKEKELCLPQKIQNNMKMRDAVRTCLAKYPIGFVDMMNILGMKHPMTDVEASYAACFMMEVSGEGEEICPNYLPELMEKNPDKDRAAQVIEAYNKCKEAKGYTDKCFKRDDFEEIKTYFHYMYDCLPEHCDDMSYDDVCPLH
ncbi:Protein of unknown function [Gryllus bimaculatus]|nr:Protein of unknown function [Gryllus bimaculatus]